MILVLTTPAWAATTRCTTDEEQTLGRLQTLCDDGTQAVSTDNKTLERWETTITESSRKACTGRLNPRTRQVEGRCRQEDRAMNQGLFISIVTACADLRTFPKRGSDRLM